jgi:hypothetical protein
MYKMYKDGEEILAERKQIPLFEADGWSLVKPEVEVAPAEDETTPPVDEDTDDSSEESKRKLEL